MTDSRKAILDYHKGILQHGTATYAEMLTALFGHWPPKGLDPVAMPRGEVETLRLQEADRDENGKIDVVTAKRRYNLQHAVVTGNRSGLLSDKAGQKIFIKFIATDSLEFISHEFAHVLQETYIGGEYVRNGNYITDGEGKSYPDTLVRHFLGEREKRASVFLKEIGAEKGQTQEEIDQNIFYELRYLKWKEIQAVLFSIVVLGYREWGKIPQGKLELLGALNNLGFTLYPPQYGFSKEEWKESCKKFPCSDDLKDVLSFSLGFLRESESRTSFYLGIKDNNRDKYYSIGDVPDSDIDYMNALVSLYEGLLYYLNDKAGYNLGTGQYLKERILTRRFLLGELDRFDQITTQNIPAFLYSFVGRSILGYTKDEVLERRLIDLFKIPENERFLKFPDTSEEFLDYTFSLSFFRYNTAIRIFRRILDVFLSDETEARQNNFVWLSTKIKHYLEAVPFEERDKSVEGRFARIFENHPILEATVSVKDKEGCAVEQPFLSIFRELGVNIPASLDAVAKADQYEKSLKDSGFNVKEVSVVVLGHSLKKEP